MAGFMNMGSQGIKALFIWVAGVGVGANLYIGDITTLSGTQPEKQLVIESGTIPDASTDGVIMIGAKDATSDYDSTLRSVLSVYSEADVTTDTAETASHKLPVVVNGTKYYIRLKSI